MQLHAVPLGPTAGHQRSREKRPVPPTFDKALDHNEAAYQSSANQACTKGSGWPLQLPEQLCSDKR